MQSVWASAMLHMPPDRACQTCVCLFDASHFYTAFIFIAPTSCDWLDPNFLALGRESCIPTLYSCDWYQWIPASSGSTTRESIVSGRTWALPWGVIYYNLFTVVVQKQYISGYSLCQSHELYEKENGINVRFLPVEKGSNVHPPQGPRRERRAVFPGKHSPETKQDSRIFRSW